MADLNQLEVRHIREKSALEDPKEPAKGSWVEVAGGCRRQPSTTRREEKGNSRKAHRGVYGSLPQGEGAGQQTERQGAEEKLRLETDFKQGETEQSQSPTEPARRAAFPTQSCHSQPVPTSLTTVMDDPWIDTEQRPKTMGETWMKVLILLEN